MFFQQTHHMDASAPPGLLLPSSAHKERPPLAQLSGGQFFNHNGPRRDATTNGNCPASLAFQYSPHAHHRNNDDDDGSGDRMAVDHGTDSDPRASVPTLQSVAGDPVALPNTSSPPPPSQPAPSTPARVHGSHSHHRCVAFITPRRRRERQAVGAEREEDRESKGGDSRSFFTGGPFSGFNAEHDSQRLWGASLRTCCAAMPPTRLIVDCRSSHVVASVLFHVVTAICRPVYMADFFLTLAPPPQQTTCAGECSTVATQLQALREELGRCERQLSIAQQKQDRQQRTSIASSTRSVGTQAGTTNWWCDETIATHASTCAVSRSVSPPIGDACRDRSSSSHNNNNNEKEDGDDDYGTNGTNGPITNCCLLYTSPSPRDRG